MYIGMTISGMTEVASHTGALLQKHLMISRKILS